MYNRSEGPPNRPLFDHNNDDVMNPNLNEEEEEDLNYYRHDSDMDQLERGCDQSFNLCIDSNLLKIVVKLISCVEEMENVVGDTIPESLLISAAKRCKYDIKTALDSVLSAHTSNSDTFHKKPQKNALNSGKKHSIF